MDKQSPPNPRGWKARMRAAQAARADRQKEAKPTPTIPHSGQGRRKNKRGKHR